MGGRGGKGKGNGIMSSLRNRAKVMFQSVSNLIRVINDILRVDAPLGQR